VNRHEITGRAWVVGDGVNTDAMYPGVAMRLPLDEAARYVLLSRRSLSLSRLSWSKG
jgi:3-isopropylmalate/(R)-2-methylmalate dehydratase small subunit